MLTRRFSGVEIVCSADMIHAIRTLARPKPSGVVTCTDADRIVQATTT
jgi:hypothetical protein